MKDIKEIDKKLKEEILREASCDAEFIKYVLDKFYNKPPEYFESDEFLKEYERFKIEDEKKDWLKGPKPKRSRIR